MNKKIFTETVGWYGVVALIGAYMLVSFSLVGPHDISFQMLNITGSIGIVINALAKKDHQPAVLNIIWAAIGIIALIKILI